MDKLTEQVDEILKKYWVFYQAPYTRSDVVKEIAVLIEQREIDARLDG